jgi:hypothetical protein
MALGVAHKDKTILALRHSKPEVRIRFLGTWATSLPAARAVDKYRRRIVSRAGTDPQIIRTRDESYGKMSTLRASC